jgi:glycosyltransferase involved in cell wall biosynthesis
MPTAVLQVDASRLPPRLEVPEGYQRALILVWWRTTPVGQVDLPVRRGVVAGDELRQAVIATAGGRIAECRLAEFLGLDAPERETTPPATVAVCTRDRPEDLGRCLAAIAGLVDDGHEILVVDSASASDATRQIAERHPGVRYLREERPGLDRARNRAIREARHEIVAFTDDDATPDRGWLPALALGFRDPRTLCVTGLTLPLELETPAQEWFERTNGFGRGYRPAVHDGIGCDPFFVHRVGAGVNMALRRSVLDLVGPFDDALDAGTPTRSGGDHDMFTRVLAAGYRIEYRPTAVNWHRHRRGWDELKAAIYGYGVGVYGYLTGRLLDGEARAVVVALWWLPWQLAALGRGLLRRPGSMPPELMWAELRGCVAGPAAYVRSRRRQRNGA